MVVHEAGSDFFGSAAGHRLPVLFLVRFSLLWLSVRVGVRPATEMLSASVWNRPVCIGRHRCISPVLPSFGGIDLSMSFDFSQSQRCSAGRVAGGGRSSTGSSKVAVFAVGLSAALSVVSGALGVPL